MADQAKLRAHAENFPIHLLVSIEESAVPGWSGHGEGVDTGGKRFRWYFQPHPLWDAAQIWVEFNGQQPPQSVRFERKVGRAWAYIGPSRIDGLIEFDTEVQRRRQEKN